MPETKKIKEYKFYAKEVWDILSKEVKPIKYKIINGGENGSDSEGDRYMLISKILFPYPTKDAIVNCLLKSLKIKGKCKLLRSTFYDDSIVIQIELQ